MRPVGPHNNGYHHEQLAYYAEAKPNISLILNPSSDAIPAIRSAWDHDIILRMANISDQAFANMVRNEGPERAAELQFSAFQNDYLGRGIVGNYNILHNEALQTGSGDVALLSRYDIRVMQLMEAHGLKAAVGAPSVGWFHLPGDDNAECLKAYRPALEKAHDGGHLFLVHEYGPHRIFGPAYRWPEYDYKAYLTRWVDHLFPWYRSQGARLPKFVVSEGSFDAGVYPDHLKAEWPPGTPHGWRRPRPWGYGDDAQGVQAYADDVYKLVTEHYMEDPLFRGLLLYCLGTNGDPLWDSFRSEPVLINLGRRNYAEVPVDPPVDPPTDPTPPAYELPQAWQDTFKWYITPAKKTDNGCFRITNIVLFDDGRINLMHNFLKGGAQVASHALWPEGDVRLLPGEDFGLYAQYDAAAGPGPYWFYAGDNPDESDQLHGLGQPVGHPHIALLVQGQWVEDGGQPPTSGGEEEWEGKVTQYFTNCGLTQLIGRVVDESGQPLVGQRLEVTWGEHTTPQAHTFSGEYVRPETGPSGWDFFLKDQPQEGTYKVRLTDISGNALTPWLSVALDGHCYPGAHNVAFVEWTRYGGDPPTDPPVYDTIEAFMIQVGKDHAGASGATIQPGHSLFDHATRGNADITVYPASPEVRVEFEGVKYVAAAFFQVEDDKITRRDTRYAPVTNYNDIRTVPWT